MKPTRRAKKGSVEAQLPLRMSVDLRAEVGRAARRDKVSASEWIREAVAQRLKR